MVPILSQFTLTTVVWSNGSHLPFLRCKTLACQTACWTGKLSNLLPLIAAIAPKSSSTLYRHPRYYPSVPFSLKRRKHNTFDVIFRSYNCWFTFTSFSCWQDRCRRQRPWPLDLENRLPNLSLFFLPSFHLIPLHIVVFSPTDAATFTLGMSIWSCRHTNALTQMSVFVDAPPPKRHTSSPQLCNHVGYILGRFVTIICTGHTKCSLSFALSLLSIHSGLTLVLGMRMLYAVINMNVCYSLAHQSATASTHPVINNTFLCASCMIHILAPCRTPWPPSPPMT